MLGDGGCWGLVMARRIATGLPGFRRSALRGPAVASRAIYPPPGMHLRALRGLRANAIAHARPGPGFIEAYA